MEGIGNAATTSTEWNQNPEEFVSTVESRRPRRLLDACHTSWCDSKRSLPCLVDLSIVSGLCFPPLCSKAQFPPFFSAFVSLQKLHEQHISGDPADLVPLAYNLLLTKPHQLSKLRTKLHHIILDEYQDISVAQHALIRLVVRGLVDELDYIADSQSNVPPVLASECKQCPLYNTSIIQVPNLFCAGDSEQSIYGFRGAAPQISVTGFRKDFPQGVIVHLDTSFRLPNRMWSTVNALVGDDGRTLSTETFPRSPVGDLRARSTVLETLDKCSSVHNVDLLSDLLADELSHALTETVHIQGVWDCREEAKHIATLIKRRAKERTRLLNHACSPLNPTQSSQISDPFEVAIIVRAGNQLDMIREALDNAGISYMDMNRQVKISARSMTGAKPVVLTTMHGSKGEEFDEVYLPGWSEGVFPHPSAVSTNRIEEERRLAYVAISRARYRVYITHAFIRRAMHVGKNLGQKMVTLQVRPSRFLYELVPNGAYSNTGQIDNSNTIENIEGAATIPTITWDRKRGSKGGIAGANLPGYFQKSYMAPRGFHSPDLPDHELLIMHRQLEEVMKMHTNHPHQKKRTKQRQRRQTSPFVLTPTMLTGLEFDSVLKMINDILAGKRGSCTKHKASFLQTLKSSFGFTRGKIILLPCEAEVKTLSRLDRLKVLGLFKELPGEGLLMRPLSQSTALQIGLFLLFSLQHHSSAQLAPAA